MFTYHTQKEPIRHRTYGRYMQKLVEHITEHKSEEEQARLAPALFKLMRTLRNNEKSKSSQPAEDTWGDLALISDYTIKLAGCPSSPPQARQYVEAPKNPQVQIKQFRCCGIHLVMFIRQVAAKMETWSPEEQLSVVVQLIKTVQRFHKQKNNLKGTLHHIEEIVGKKLDINEEALELFFVPKNNYNHRKKRFNKQEKKH